MSIHSGLTMKAKIAGIPVVFHADLSRGGEDGTVYAFDTFVDRYEVDLKDFLADLFKRFDVEVDLPPELQLEAAMEYLVGRVEIHKQIQEGTGGQSSPARKPRITLAAAFSLTVEEGETAESFDLQFFYSSLESEDAENPQSGYTLGLSFGKGIELANLPFIGRIPQIANLSIPTLGFAYTKLNGEPAKPEDQEKKPVKFHIPRVRSGVSNPFLSSSGGEDAKALGESWGPFESTRGGFALIGGLFNEATQTLRSIHLPLSLPPKKVMQEEQDGSGADNTNNTVSEPPPSSSADSPIKWMNIQKAFGPVEFNRLGLAYRNRRIFFYADASFSLSFLSLSIDQLGIGFDIPARPSEIKPPSFSLGGLSTHVKAGPLDIAGGFISVDDRFDSFLGQLVVKAGDFTLEAFGGFTVSTPSFFVFLRINAPLGGPPYFFITGLSGGFGINYQFRMPTFDELDTFPLLPGNADNPIPVGAPKDTAAITKTLRSLSNFISPKEGQFWMALGIEFNSFKMIDVQAILTVSFGVEFEVSLLGNASMSFPARETLPAGTPPIANISINFIVSFNPAAGLLRAEGKLTPASFIYSPAARLSGGFAFYVWFSGEHEGDFVMTVGGYHPRYNKPAHYPAVPRLQLNWSMGPLQIVGQAYFALTPKEMMFGLSVTATWESGNIKAWFRLSFDFFIAWNPLYYRADGVVTVGVSVTLDLWVTTETLSIEVSVGLSIWGNPFGGRAVIDLDIVSFTIDFGAPELTRKTVGWNEFKGFLPGNEKESASSAQSKGVDSGRTNPSLVGVTVKDGLLKGAGADLDGVIDPYQFEILIQTNAPCTNAFINVLDSASLSKLGKLDPGSGEAGKEETNDWNQSIGIAPMGLSTIKSWLHITISKKNTATDKFEPFNDFRWTPIIKNAPGALWNGNSAAGDNLVKNTLVGFNVFPGPSNPGQTKDIAWEKLVFKQGKERHWLAAAPVNVAGSAFSGTLNFEKSRTEGKSIVAHLNDFLGFDLNIPADPKELAKIEYLDDPKQMHLGEIIAVD